MVTLTLPRKRTPPYIPDFKKAFQHFCIHAGGRAIIDGLEENLKVTPRAGCCINGISWNHIKWNHLELHCTDMVTQALLLFGMSCNLLRGLENSRRATKFGKLLLDLDLNVTVQFGKD
jgi:hypothetical protein